MINLFFYLKIFIKIILLNKGNPLNYDSKNKLPTDDTINGTINDTIKLTKNEQLVLNLILNNAKMTREEIVNKTKLSDRTISRVIKHLQDNNIISRKGSKKTGYWKILK